MAKNLHDWHVWRAFDKDTGETLAVRVVQKGRPAQHAFSFLAVIGKSVGYERRATVHNCTEAQAVDVMSTLHPEVVGLAN